MICQEKTRTPDLQKCMVTMAFLFAVLEPQRLSFQINLTHFSQRRAPDSEAVKMWTMRSIATSWRMGISVWASLGELLLILFVFDAEKATKRL